MSAKCDAEVGGYDGMFAVYCDLPSGHDGFHVEGDGAEFQGIEWDHSDPRFRNSHFPSVAALVATLSDLIDAAEGIAVYPEGSFGFENLSDAIARAKTILGI